MTVCDLCREDLGGQFTITCDGCLGEFCSECCSPGGMCGDCEWDTDLDEDDEEPQS